MPITRHLFAVALAAALAWGSAQAYTLEEFQFDNPAQEADFRTLIGKLRCLVCQNESLAASQADLAQDLRQEVYDLMRSGKSNAEIIDFLVSRYGDFVLYQPPVKPSTYLIWFGPFVLIAVGAFLLFRVLRQKGAEPEAEVSAADEARIDALLKAESGSGQDQ